MHGARRVRAPGADISEGGEPRAHNHHTHGQTRPNMVTTWLLLFISVAASQELHANKEEIILNTTTLYPVKNITIDFTTNENLNRNQTEDNRREQSKPNISKDVKIIDEQEKYKVEISSPKRDEVTKWSLDAKFSVNNNNNNNHNDMSNNNDKQNEVVQVQRNNKETEKSTSNHLKEQLPVGKLRSEEERVFKPSPHVESFFDDDNLNMLKISTPGSSFPVEGKPVRHYPSSKDLYMLKYKTPQDPYRGPHDAPYRFEGANFWNTNSWKNTLESKPTVESSVKIPAGGLYKRPLFKKPASGEEDEGFPLAYNEDGRETERPHNKGSNPWKNLLHLLTAFLPVGLIVSALTPNVVTLPATDNNPYGRLSRADAGLAALPAISERCRRRLLCEIHSDEHYGRSEASRVPRKQCYRLRCEEPGALRAALAWLLGRQASLRPPLPLTMSGTNTADTKRSI